MNRGDVFKFGEFTLNVPERRLSKGAVGIPLEPTTCDLLTILVRRAGQLTTKHELLALVWPDAFVEEAIIAVHVSTLRKALGDTHRAHRYIETVPRSGYRFVAGVRTVQTTREGRRRAATVRPRHHDAHGLYLRGRYLWERRTQENALKAIRYFEAALEKDSECALAWSGLAACYSTLPLTNGAQPRQAFPKAKAAAVRALELDSALCEAHLSLAAVRFWFDWDWSGAEREFRCAIDLDPGGADGHRFFGHFLSNMGRHGEALREARAAVAIEPLSIVTNARLAQFLYQAGEYDRALDQLQSTIELEPNFWMVHLVRGQVLEMVGRRREAMPALRQAVTLANASGEAKAALGYTLAGCGEIKAARDILTELADRRRQGHSQAYHLALVCAGLGDRDGMQRSLNQALVDRDVGLTFIGIERRWRPYADDLVVQQVTAALGFPSP